MTKGQTLTVLGFGELEAAFRTAAVDVVWTDEVGTTLESETDLTTELFYLVRRLTDVHHGTVTLALVSATRHMTLHGASCHYSQPQVCIYTTAPHVLI